jgi:uncharacterized membrane protein (DUF4010 family)
MDFGPVNVFDQETAPARVFLATGTNAISELQIAAFQGNENLMSRVMAYLGEKEDARNGEV